MLALADTRATLLLWLEGRVGGTEGKRVLLFTYNDSGYLGLIRPDDPEFVHRHHMDGTTPRLSPIHGGGDEAEEIFAKQCGQEIKRLVEEGLIVKMPTPREYEGAAVLYERRTLH